MPVFLPSVGLVFTILAVLVALYIEVKGWFHFDEPQYLDLDENGDPKIVHGTTSREVNDEKIEELENLIAKLYIPVVYSQE